VQEHYNVIKEKNRDDRQKSDAYSLRCFNNWVKQVQIEDSVNQVVESLGAETNSGIRVLDICCGKGGDQNKWKKKELVKHIDFVDISNVSVRECEHRYNSNKSVQERYTANFYVADCTQPITDPGLAGPYDIVTCQFAIHYSFESCTQAENFIKNVSDRLKPGGVFIISTVNDYEIIYRAKRKRQELLDKNIIKSKSESTDKISFGNSLYNIKIDKDVDLDRPQLFGCKYYYGLDGLIDDLSEFLVNKALLKQICSEHNLKLAYNLPFREFFQKFSKDPYYRKLLKVFKALKSFNPKTPEYKAERDPHLEYQRPRQAIEKLFEMYPNEGIKTVGTMAMSDWEAATIYTTFSFIKEKNGNVSGGTSSRSANLSPHKISNIPQPVSSSSQIHDTNVYGNVTNNRNENTQNHAQNSSSDSSSSDSDDQDEPITHPTNNIASRPRSAYKSIYQPKSSSSSNNFTSSSNHMWNVNALQGSRGNLNVGEIRELGDSSDSDDEVDFG